MLFVVSLTKKYKRTHRFNRFSKTYFTYFSLKKFNIDIGLEEQQIITEILGKFFGDRFIPTIETSQQVISPQLFYSYFKHRRRTFYIFPKVVTNRQKNKTKKQCSVNCEK